MKKGTLLIVDDNKSIVTALKILLNTIFENILAIHNPNQLHTMLRENKVDVILLDMNFSSGVNSGNEGLFWLSEIKKERQGIEVVLFTAYGDISLAVNAMKNGACDFVVKPWDNSKLIATLQNAYNLSVSRNEVKQLKEIKIAFGSQGNTNMYWGNSSKMAELQKIVRKVAPTDANILIIGENGTGKEVLAQEIHQFSARKGESLVSVDMGSITETLFESELFGHVKGAFTDAKGDRAGKFEAADKGTLFLDEIANLPMHLQSKLLTVLQTRKVIRVGSNTPIDVDIRLISATNGDIEAMVADNRFRMDLMYRLNTITIHLPALRERKEDIIPLAERFLQKYSWKYNKPDLFIEEQVKEKLQEYDWPGNIRELQHAIEKAVIICNQKSLTVADFMLSKPSGQKNAGTLEDQTLEEMERNMIEQSLRKFESNMSLVAESLGISRQTLYNKIKKYNL